MSRKTIIKRLGAVLCSLGVLCWTSVLLLMNSFAADGITNLTIECQTLWGDIIPGEEWSIYKVAELQEDGTCELYGDFAQYPVSFEDFSASALTDIARTLENYVVLDGVAPYASGISDDNGEVFFSDVPDGIYLLFGKYVELNDMTYSPAPFIVSVDYEGDGEPMNLYAYAKYTVISTASYGRYAVVKEFGNEASVPVDEDAFVTVEIYCDGNLYKTVTLNAKNKWTHSWVSDDYHDWRIKEVGVPDEYYVNYSRERAVLKVVNTKKKVMPGNNTLTTTTTTTTTETTTTITSSKTTSTTSSKPTSTTSSKPTSTTSSKPTSTTSSEVTVTTDTSITSEMTSTTTDTTVETSSTQTSTTSISSTVANGTTVITTTSSEKLPQTGQLWWPIPILSIAGMVFLSAGLVIRSKDSE